MGRKSRRYRRRKKRNQEAKKKTMENKEKRTLETRMKALMKDEEYAKALDVLAEMIQDKAYEAEDLYRGAYCYFMTGDYQRAAAWLTNTLSFVPNHVAARLLLARICILEDRIDDGLAIYDFILEHYEQALQPEQREDMEDILEYYVSQDKERIKEQFPYVAVFMHVEGAEKPAKTAPATVEASVEAPAGADVHLSVAQGGKRTDVHVPQEAPAAAAPIDAEATDVTEASVAQEAEEQLARVQASGASVAERLRMLNAFAGGYFVADEFAAAKSFLKAALELDAQDDATLRNLAMLAKAEGDGEKALQFASAMRHADFVLLAALKG